MAKAKDLFTSYSKEELIRLYRLILKPRLIEERMLILLRQGKISKWFSGIGQEAIAVGASAALEDDEYILPLHRNLGVFTTRNIPLSKLFMQWQGKLEGFTKGRDRSFHFGTTEYHIVGMISHLGPQLCVADGIALAHKLKKERKVTLVFSGDGGTSEGDFHEALNVAACWDLPVIFLIENNGYALSTPVKDQFRCANLTDRAVGYGMEGVQVDGNNLLEVHSVVSELAASMRKKPRPVLIECMTFRMSGHEEASGTKYVPKELFAEWKKKDPVDVYEAKLIKDKTLSKTEVEAIRAEMNEEILAKIELGLAGTEVEADTEVELGDVYAPHTFIPVTPKISAVSEKRLVDAVSDGLRAALHRHSNLILMGQDIAEYGGVFKVTEGFLKEFGPERIRNTPLCESAILGAGLGLSLKGFKSVIEMQFSDFVTSGFNPIVNNLAKVHYRWGGSADVVVRMPTGAGTRAGPFHSQSTEAWFTHVPGLKVVYPAFPKDAKGLLLSSIEDPNPVMFFEHKLLYRSIKESVPDEYFNIELGKANLLREGTDVTIITYGLGVHWALDTLSRHPEISAELIDLRTLLPLDFETIAASVEKTGRVIILHEDLGFGGIGGEISAQISEKCFQYLEAPIVRSTSLDTPIPFTGVLEDNFFPKGRFEKQLQELLKF